MNPDQPIHRRHLLIGGALAGLGTLIPKFARTSTTDFELPVGLPDRPPGDGFYIRHGFDCENTWFAPHWWHTGENWYLTEGESAGAEVYAIADGTVVYAGFDYPGTVVIVEHAVDLYSMYGHLEHELPVAAGQDVGKGDTIGLLLNRTDGRAPSHLHFEIRDFLSNPIVNGDTPKYELGCGYQCPPGPGYWPMIDEELPVAFGWMNPMHAIAHSASQTSDVFVNSSYGGTKTDIASQPGGRKNENVVDSLLLESGMTFELLDIHADPVDTIETSARAYHVWYEIRYRGGATGWVRATKPSYRETGNDGRPSAIDLLLLPRR